MVSLGYLNIHSNKIQLLVYHLKGVV